MPLSRRRFLTGLGVATAAAAAPAAASSTISPTPILSAWARGGAALPGITSLVRVRMDGDVLGVLLERFDVTEHVHDGWVEVVLHPGDRPRLDALGARYDVVEPDLDARMRAVAQREARLAAAAPQTRQAYRTLAEYVADLDRLAAIAPQLARRFELPTPTHQGRKLQGVVLGTGSGVNDGRPTAFLCGLHHAREWPSGELTMMFAEDLVDGFIKGDAESVELLSSLRLIVIPVSNPDGFVRSRELVPYTHPTVDGALQTPQEGPYHRKNLRPNNGVAPGGHPVEQAAGVDTNRNYPWRWGGPGSSTSTTSQTYAGPAAGSEPEVVAMTGLFRSEQILAGISNHTHGNLVLRPWGYTNQPSPDEGVLKALGDRMASRNAYKSGLWNVALYPGTGIIDDWSYGLLGTLCYTLEHGSAFHAAYGDTVPAQYAKNRPAFVDMLRAALDPQLHGVLEGTAPAGTVLELRKTATTPFSRASGGATSVSETATSRLTVGPSGSFTWHVNPSPTAATLLAIESGAATEADRERYTVTATRPDGTATTSSLLVERGGRYRLDA